MRKSLPASDRRGHSFAPARLARTPTVIVTHMTHMTHVAHVTLVTLLALLAQNGCTEAGDEAPYTSVDLLAEGPHPVGYRTLTLADESRPTWSSADASDLPSRTLVTEVYYPAQTAGRDAIPTKEARTLVVYAHGLMGDRHNNALVAMLLSSHGLVVAAPDFPRTRMGTPGGVVFEDVRFQPGDVGFVIDEMQRRSVDAETPGAGHPADALLDGRVLLVGYSLGAFTATLAGFHPAERHPAVSAVVLMAPSGCFVPDNTFEAAPLPLLILHGDRDAIIPYENGPEALFGAARGPRWLLTLRDGTHTGFVDALADLLDGLTHADSVGCDAIAGAIPTDPADVREEYASWWLGMGGMPLIPSCTPACSSPELLTRGMRPTRQVEILMVAIRAFTRCILEKDSRACRFLDRSMASQYQDVETESAEAESE